MGGSGLYKNNLDHDGMELAQGKHAARDRAMNYIRTMTVARLFGGGFWLVAI